MSQEIAITYQCPECLRQHDGAGVALAFRPCVPDSRACGLTDCGAVAEENDRREKLKAERRHARWKARHPRSNCRHERAPKAPAHPVERREPYPVDSDDTRTPIASSQTPLAGVTAKDFSQRDYQESGAAASQNEKLLKFFREPKNFGLWFKSTLLEDLSRARRMNNRAVDLREVVKAEGLWIDNFMIRDEHTDSLSSCYRLCRIEDALCLSTEKKQELAAAVSHRGQ